MRKQAKRYRWWILGSIAGAFVTHISASAANHVRVEAISNVTPGTAGLTIGVYISNDVPLVAMVLPLEIRSCGDAYMVGPNFGHRMNPAGRLYNSPLSPDADSNGQWPPAIYTARTFAVDSPADGYGCVRPLESARSWRTAAAAPDFQSPDAILMVSVSAGDPRIGEEISLDPGADPPGVPSYVITMNVGMDSGLIVIDTTCIWPANTLAFVTWDLVDVYPILVHPTFEMGTIGVGVPAGPCQPDQCSCPCHGNPANCSSPPLGILDIITVIDVAFRAVPAAQSGSCPYTNTDLNCSGLTDIVDVVKSINVEFRGSDPESEYCEPCAL